MNNIQKRFVYFLGGCIPARVLLAIIAKYIPLSLLRIMGLITIIPAVWFLYSFIITPYTHAKIITSTKVWWQDMRIIHSMSYLLFSIFAINQKPYSWIVLFVDAIVGLFAFLIYHYSIKSFEKLF